MEHEIFLDLAIADFEDVTHEDITQQLGIIPKRIYVKGTKRYPNSSVGTLIRRNRWIMGSSLDEHSTFEDQLNALLDIIESKIDLFKIFCEKYNCVFSCAIYLRCESADSTPWIHLDSRYNKLIQNLNITFEFDLYTLPKIQS